MTATNYNFEDVLKQRDNSERIFNDIQQDINEGIVLYGAGQYGGMAMEYLQKNNYSVTCIVDSSPKKIGTHFGGVPIVSINDERVGEHVILITARHSFHDILQSLALPNLVMSFDSWFLHTVFDKYQMIRSSILNDTRSKDCIDGIMIAMFTGDETHCEKIMDFKQYFCLPNFVNVDGEVFVDAGAYVGDTVEKFIWESNGAFKKIYAFEPNIIQYNCMLNRKKRLINEWALPEDSIVTINGGLGEVNSIAELSVQSDHLQGTILKPVKRDEIHTDTCKIYTLDSIIDEKVTIIKSDIEGMEMSMLRGGRQTIANSKPKLALSVYHKPDDLINIIDYVIDIDHEYNFALRHHSPMIMDTTLYCWK